ncbi:MAG: hypothetical protein JSR78_10780, partial [Proteobacteria bacterium]|nr:hypothetical protein [Pseudomonadota bacterium]
EYGCAYTPAHVFNPDITDATPKKPNSRATYAAKHGAPTNRLQWSKASARGFGRTLSENLTPSSTWDDLVMAIADHGLALERKGKGLVVGNADSYATFSSLGLNITAKGHPRLLRHRSHASAPSILSVDGIDIVRALMGFGLADRDDLIRAVNDAKHERAAHRKQRQHAPRRLAGLGTSLSIPQTGLMVTPHRSNSTDRPLSNAAARSRR